MSNTTTVELPKFKDKVMYITSSSSNSKLHKSYQISASYHGIVRLSPNNRTILLEDNTFNMDSLDEQVEGALYSDAIKFQDDALSAIKSDCDITRRMIIASESTGFFVNFRISDRDVQFDSLGVIGITETEHLTLFSRDASYNNMSFTLNGSAMPSKANLPEISTEVLYSDIDATQPIPLGDYDSRRVNVRGKGDKSHIAYGIIGENGKRYIGYKQSKLFIRDAIMQALLSLQTIPTGSVHFVPVTISQYRALCENNTPNTNYSDPIVRDFLLCDGRKYYTKDFPELAKILWKEYITIWDTPHASQSNFLYPKANGDNEGIEVNDYARQTTGTKTFRVPDLRHMFIGAVHAKPQDTFNVDSIERPVKYSSHKTGYYFPDNLPLYTERYSKDKHKHFNSYGTYSGSLYSSSKGFQTEFGEFSDYIKVRTPNDANDLRLQTLKASGNAAVTALTNESWFLGDEYYNGFGTRQGSQNAHTGVDSIPVNYWASAPDDVSKRYPTDSTNEDNKKTNTVMCGMSSIQVPSIDKSAATEGDTLHGHENAPKFFAMLPLIKI